MLGACGTSASRQPPPTPSARPIPPPGSPSTPAPSPAPTSALPTLTPVAPTPAAAEPTTSPSGGRIVGFAFNAASKDVTRFDVATRQALDTKPLGATVTWLSNEQRFWDGRYIWTYDFPDNLVRAIAVDPRAVTIARSVATKGKGPAHSLMLTPDRTTAWVNAAGDDALLVLDVASGQVAGEVRTGKYP